MHSSIALMNLITDERAKKWLKFCTVYTSKKHSLAQHDKCKVGYLAKLLLKTFQVQELMSKSKYVA